MHMTSSTIPSQTPITGKEELNDLSQPVQALAQFYRAFNNRDLTLMERNWDNSAEAAMDNPVGGIRRGWTGIRGKTIDLSIRTTRLFRRAADGTWKQIHHHGSIDDPQLLATYQASVR